MKLDAWKTVLNVFWLILAIETLIVVFWVMVGSEIPLFVFIAYFLSIFFLTLSIIAFKRKKGILQVDERTKMLYERSVMIAGIAGLLMLLQIAIVEIISGIIFRATSTFLIAGMVFIVTIAVANTVQNRFG